MSKPAHQIIHDDTDNTTDNTVNTDYVNPINNADTLMDTVVRYNG
jgi:hypothetical protein